MVSANGNDIIRGIIGLKINLAPWRNFTYGRIEIV